MITTITTSRGGTLYLDENEHGYNHNNKKKCHSLECDGRVQTEGVAGQGGAQRALQRPAPGPQSIQGEATEGEDGAAVHPLLILRRRMISFDAIINI